GDEPRKVSLGESPVPGGQGGLSRIAPPPMLAAERPAELGFVRLGYVDTQAVRPVTWIPDEEAHSSEDPLVGLPHQGQRTDPVDLPVPDVGLDAPTDVVTAE